MATAALVPVPRRSARLADAARNRKSPQPSPQLAGDSPSRASTPPSTPNQCQSPEQSSSHSLSSPSKPGPSRTTSSLPRRKPASRPPFLLPTPLSNPLLPISHAALYRVSILLSLLLSVFLTLSLGY